MFTLFPAGPPYGLRPDRLLRLNVWSAVYRMGLCRFAGPWVGGYLKDTTGTYYMPFIIGAIVVAVSVIISATLKAPATKDLE